MTPDRIAFFEDYLTRKPNDDFARYALAMEYSKAGRHDEALASYGKLVEINPDYSAGYFQAALLLQKLGRIPEAKDHLRRGIEAATRAKDAHARREMEGVLADIEDNEG